MNLNVRLSCVFYYSNRDMLALRVEAVVTDRPIISSLLQITSFSEENAFP
jgi:hypothetical protein